MSNKNLTTITILDKDYQVACPPGERESLLTAAEDLDERMRAIRNTGSIIGLERIAVMAALNLCHEIQASKSLTDTSSSSEDLEEALTGFNKKITEAIRA